MGHARPLPSPGTKVYIDLMFAYALARLGEATEARKLLGAQLFAP